MRNRYGYKLAPRVGKVKIQVSVGQVLYVPQYGLNDEDGWQEIEARVVGNFGDKVLAEVLSKRTDNIGVQSGMLVELYGYEIGLPF